MDLTIEQIEEETLWRVGTCYVLHTFSPVRGSRFMVLTAHGVSRFDTFKVAMGEAVVEALRA